MEAVTKDMAGKEYSHLKKQLADLLVSEICPVGKEITKLMNDKGYLLQILKKAQKKQGLKLRRTLKLYVKKLD